MPGIFGCIYRNGNPIPKEVAANMADSLKHEDWYVDEWILDPCLLGTVELGFLHHEHNLVYDKGSSLSGVSRGNIYNKQELCKKFGIECTSSLLNDTQFVIELYDKKGLDFVKYLNGLFNVAIYEREADRVIVANDRYGFYPLFYYLNQKMFVFASEAKAIFAASAIAPRINKSAVPEFFSFTHLLGDETFFEQVRYLQPATILTYDKSKDQVLMQQYWDFTSKQHKKHKIENLDSLLKSFRKLMKKAVERTVQDKKEIGVFLSGGLDSRIVTAFASETDADVITFTFGARNCPQQQIARRIAEELGVKNVFYEIPSDFIANFAEKIVYQGDGLIRIRDCHFIACLESIRKKIDTVLMGTFGGDLFGYNITALFWSMKRGSFKWRSGIKGYIFKDSIRGLPPEAYHEAFDENFYLEAKRALKMCFNREFNRIVGIKEINPFDLVDYWDYCVREPRYIYQAFQFINWYVETRHPFLDNDLVDFFALRLPLQLRLGESFLKKAINHCFPKLSSIPLEQGAPPDADPTRVFLSRLKRFVLENIKRTMESISKGNTSTRPLDYREYGNWLRTGSRDYVISLVLDSRLLRKYFKEDFIRKILNEHMSAKNDHNMLICDLINFELANRIFFEATG